MTSTPLKAIIFDLFGTLVYDRFSSRHYDDLMRYLALQLGGSEERMRQCWNATFKNRVAGDYSSIVDNLAQISAQEGWNVDLAKLEEAQSYFHEFTLQSMSPVPGAIETLTACRRHGLKVGLMSDCSTAVPAIWKRTQLIGSFDATLFSCEEKVHKPDPEFYRRCLGLLGVAAGDCVYVGDGGGNELQGALDLGLRPVMVTSLIDPLEKTRLIVPDWARDRVIAISDIMRITGLE